MKHRLGGKIMGERILLRLKTYSYLKNDGYVIKKEKSARKGLIKHGIKFENYKNCLEKNEKIAFQSKGLRVKHTMYVLRTLTRSHRLLMIVKD